MQLYKNLNGNSGVYAYEIGGDYIQVQFTGGERIYQYSYLKAGAGHVEEMKRLAVIGKGLSGYIARYTKDLYD